MKNPDTTPSLKFSNSGLFCLLTIIEFYNKKFDEALFRNIISGNSDKTSLLDLAKIAEKFGFRTRIDYLTYEDFAKNIGKPSIVILNNQFSVILSKRFLFFKNHLLCYNIDEGRVKYKKQEFIRLWHIGTEDKNTTNAVLFIEPGPNFYKKEKPTDNKLGWNDVLRYFHKNKVQVIQVFVSLFLATVLQVIFPFLIQSIIDVGISTQNLNYILIILTAQLILVFSRALIDFVRGQLLLHISTMVNLSIISDFWIKLGRLPIDYFEQNHAGDILQRINDNKLIQDFLTGPGLTTLYSIINFFAFAFVLIMFKVELFLIFLIGVVLYVTWMILFLKIRRKLNYRIFESSSKENNATLQLINGMHEIKLQNIELPIRWQWENVQAKIFNLNFKMLTVEQLQQAGVIIINQSKDVILIFIMAKLVINGELTLGAMLALQYVIGQLSWPVEQFINTIPALQDAKISMERLSEIHKMTDEEIIEKEYMEDIAPESKIVINNLSFTYKNGSSDAVLKNVNLIIPNRKITAIVGGSGSGKTTLLKILLKFYENYSGEIKLGTLDMTELSPSSWRNNCGSVLQEGFIFNDTIARNIELQYNGSDEKRLTAACEAANILPFIDSLPNGFDTMLGVDGMGISQGQKQRLLIARAVYKNPRYLFLDESTNALDSNNEKIIVKNLKQFFENRTVVIVAHRLSTVKNADKIVVLHKGTIVEEGIHQELLNLQGRYYELVKNQL